MNHQADQNLKIQMLNQTVALCAILNVGQNQDIQILNKIIALSAICKLWYQVGQNQEIQMLNKAVSLIAICEIPGGLEPGDLKAE